MPVSTVGQYLSALEKSKLLGSEQFVEAQRLAGESSDAAALAKALARENLVSLWQAGTLLALGQRAQLRMGKYKLIQRLGKGGMGTVFLAEHVTMNRRVALKIVPRSIAEDRAALDRFFAEARAIAALDHPNIVQAYSVDNEMDRYFIVMEFVDGQDLQRLVEVNGPLDFDQAADYISQAAEGLAHAHARNLVHCDIKPSNLLVNNQGVIKILDLGLARLKQSDEPRGSAVGEPAFGTVDYMAPEQAMETANFNHRADIYSLGCTLYFLLTGHPPFPGGTLAQRIVKHQTQEPRDILLERPNTPPQLVEVCKRMMAKEPENRFQSAQEVSAALAPWQDRSTAATDGCLSQAVKPLDDITSVAAGTDDWLSSLPGPSTSRATSNGTKTPDSTLTAAKLTKSGKQRISKGRSRGGAAAMLARVLAIGRAKLGWFNTTKRKIAGAVGGSALLAAVAGLASLPFLLSNPEPAPLIALQPSHIALQPSHEEKKVSAGEEAGSPPDKSAGKKPIASQGLLGKDSPAGQADAPLKSAKAHEKPEKIESAKSTGPDKPTPNRANKTDVPPETNTVTKSDPKLNVAPAPPEKKPEPLAKPVSLDGLRTTVDLLQPGKGANAAVSLGKLDLDPKLALDIQLLGGNTVAKGYAKFELQKDGDGTTPGWSVQMTEKNKDAVKIARVWLEENELRFGWTEEAKNRATLVRYCGLQLSCEKKTHFVALSTPKIVPPLPIDVDAGATRAPLSKDFPLPDLSILRLQIVPLDPSMPKHEIKVLEVKTRAVRSSRGKSAEPVSGNTVSIKRRVMVVLTKEKTPRVAFSIVFDAHGKDSLVLDMQGVFEFSGVSMPFNWPSLREAAARIEAWLMVNDSDKNPNKKNMQGQIDTMKTTRDQLKSLGDLAGDLNQKASIPFRIYAVLSAADSETAPNVVVFQSGQLENPKAGGTKKNPKGKQPKGRATPNSDELELK